MSHRLELVITKAFNRTIDKEKSKIVSEYLDKTINKVYSYYNTQGYKRVSHLKETYETHKHKFYSLSKIIQIRWIASDYKAMNALSSLWEMIVIDLREISKDKKFALKSRNKAEKLRPKLIGKHFLLLFHFLFDIVNELSTFSLDMQRRTALIVDFNSFKSNFESMLKSLKIKNGKNLELYLNDARCEIEEDKDMDRCKSIETYLSSKKIIYKSIQLIDDESELPDLNSYRTLLLDFLLDEFNSYFPDGDLKSFDVFDPSNMPNVNDYATARTYGIVKIKQVNEFFKIGSQNLITNQWQNLLTSIVSSSNYCQIRKTRTTTFAFWSQLLKWQDIEWGPEIKSLLFTVLSIPISSAEAERGFSTHIKLFL